MFMIRIWGGFLSDLWSKPRMKREIEHRGGATHLIHRPYNSVLRDEQPVSHT